MSDARPVIRGFRLVVTEPLDGATNMAIDEACLLGRIAGGVPPTVRFYAWSCSTVSVGYGQRLDHGIDLDWCARSGIGLVRRPTGGSAVLHEGPRSEVTYSVVARPGDFAGADDVLESYRVLGRGLAAGLVRLGVAAEVLPVVRSGGSHAVPTSCFARSGAFEIAVGGKKLAGSAQRRQAQALLQHGSILLDLDPERVRSAFPGATDPAAAMTALACALGRPVGFDTVVAALAAGLGEVLGQPLEPAGLAPEELELVDRLVADKYATHAWTWRGEAPRPSDAPSSRPAIPAC